MQHPQRRHHVLHLGHDEQAAEPHHLDRNPARLDGPPQRHELRSLPAQHRDVRRPHPGRPPVRPRLPVRRAARLGREQRGDLPGDPFGLVQHRVEQGADDGPPVCPVRAGHQPRHVRGLVPQVLLDSGRGVEHPCGVPEAGRQQQHRRRTRGRRGPERPDPGDHREVDGEPPQVPRARAAPAVDGLARVPDRRHRMPAAEQRAQQHQLRVAGVLVLIEQDHLVTGPLGHPHLGVLAGDPGRQGHLIGVVKDLAGRLGRRVALDQRQQLLPGLLRCYYLPNGRWYPPRQPVPLRGEPRPHGGDISGLAQVLGQVPGQFEHGRGHRLRSPDDLVHRPVVGGHDPRRELPGQRRRDQPHGRLEPFAQGVVADQPARVGVVGPDRRIAVERVTGPGPARVDAFQFRPAQAFQPGADPVGELGRGLPGEGESEHPVRADHSVGDQPDQPRRHRLALARAGPRDDRQRPQRRGDHRGLLRRRLGQPQQPRQLSRPDLARAVYARDHPGIGHTGVGHAGIGHTDIPAETTDIWAAPWTARRPGRRSACWAADSRPADLEPGRRRAALTR